VTHVHCTRAQLVEVLGVPFNGDEKEGEMRIKQKLAITMSVGLALGGLAVGTAAAVSSLSGARYATPVSYSMIFGSSGNIVSAKGAAAGSVGSVLPGQCELYGVGDFIGSTSCPSLLSAPYQLTETPITATSGLITYFAVTTTNPAPAAGGNRINFSIRLCENAANNCNTPGGGITVARCTPLPGSKTCSWIGRVKFQQWQPSGAFACLAAGIGSCHGSDPGAHDEGLIDIVASRGCGSTCPNGTYDPGHVSWSVAYIK
jgi:hypothetical protein